MTKRKGFTLLEIMIVISIIGIIIGVLLPNYNDLRRRGRDQARKAGVKAFAEAIELYKLNQSPPAYPASINITPGAIWQVGSTVYMNKTPKDPLYSTNPTNYFYRYGRNGSDTLRYYVGVCLETADDPDGSDDPDGAGTVFVPATCPSLKWYYKIEP